MLVLIPPHVLPKEHPTIMNVLESHRLDPEPLEQCARAVFTAQHGQTLLAVLPDAPIPTPEDGQEYVLLQLRSRESHARRFLENALAAVVVNTAKIPRYIGGVRQKRTMRLPDHPNRMLRDLIIVVDDADNIGLVQRFFRKSETDDAATA